MKAQPKLRLLAQARPKSVVSEEEQQKEDYLVHLVHLVGDVSEHYSGPNITTIEDALFAHTFVRFRWVSSQN
jgi:hypothetical protein